MPSSFSGRSRSSSPEVRMTNKSRNGPNSSRGRQTAASRKRAENTSFAVHTLEQRLVEPIRLYITSNAKKAAASMNNATKVIQLLLEEPRPSDIRNRLMKANDVLKSMEKNRSILMNLENYIRDKFDDTQFQESSDKNRLFKEVNAFLEQEKVDLIIQKLYVHIKSIENLLTEHNHSIAHYISDISSSDEEENKATDCSAYQTALEKVDGTVLSKAASVIPAADVFAADMSSLSDIEKATASYRARTKALEEKIRIMREEEQKEKMMIQLAAFERLQKEKEELLKQSQLRKEQEAQRVEATTIVTAPAASSGFVIPSTAALPTPTSAPEETSPASNNISKESSNLSSTDMQLANILSMFEGYYEQQRRSSNEETKELRDRVQQYREGTNQLKDQFHSMLARKQKIQRKPPTEKECTAERHRPKAKENRSRSQSRSRSRSEESSLFSIHKTIKHLKPFNGTGNFEFFRERIMHEVLNRRSIPDVLKYYVLTEKLIEEAAGCVATAGTPQERLTNTLKNLDMIYGSKVDKHSLLKKLRSMPFNQSNTEEMQLDLFALEDTLRAICNKGNSVVDSNGTFDVVTKLPTSMRKDVTKYISEIGKDNVTQEQVISSIKRCIEARKADEHITRHYSHQKTPVNETPAAYAVYATVNPAQTSYPNGPGYGESHGVYTPPTQYRTPAINQGIPQSNLPTHSSKQTLLAYNPSLLQQNLYDPISKTYLENYYAPGPNGLNESILKNTIPNTKVSKTTCKVCDGSHFSMSCELPSWEFRKQLKERRLCPLCTGRHEITQCKSKHRCGYCDGLHHMGGCPLKEHYRDTKRWPQAQENRQSHFRGGADSSKRQ